VTVQFGELKSRLDQIAAALSDLRTAVASRHPA